MLNNFFNPRPQFTDINGNPLSLGRVSFYSAGTSTLKEVYTDKDGTIAAQNPHILDAGGFIRDGGLFMGDGMYKIVAESSDGAGGYVTEWTVDDYKGTIGASASFSTDFVSSISELRLVDTTESNLVYITGYNSVSDGGEGWFQYNASSSESENGGTIIVPDGAPALGRWERIIEQEYVTPQLFGAYDGASAVGSAFNSMITWCKNNPRYSNIRIPAQDYIVENSIELTGDISVIIENGVYFDSSVGALNFTISCTDAIIHSKGEFCDNDDFSLTFNPVTARNANIAWWNVLGSNLATTNLLSLDNISTNQKIELYEAVEIQNAGAITVDKTIEELIFYNSASLSVSGAVNIIISGYENRAGKIFSGSMDNYRFTENFDIADCDIGTTISGYYVIDATKWVDLGESLNQSDFCNCEWSAGDYRFTVDTIVGGFQTKQRVFINHGVNIRCDVATDLGYITAGNYNIFDPLGDSNIKMVTNKALLEWFGGRSGSISVDNSDAFEYAVNVQNYNALNGGRWAVVGDGGRYYINTLATLSFGSQQDGRGYFKDVEFYCDIGGASSFSFTNIDMRFVNCRFETRDTFLFGFDGSESELLLENCFVDGISDGISMSGGTLKAINSTFDVRGTAVASSATAKFYSDSCYFEGTIGGSEVVLNLLGSSEITNSRFENSLTNSTLLPTMIVNGDQSKLNNCSFQGLEFLQFESLGGVVSGCTFKGSVLKIEKAINNVVIGCTFDSYDYGGTVVSSIINVNDGGGSLGQVDGLSITSNTFTSSIAESTTISVTNNWGGANYATIRDNYADPVFQNNPQSVVNGTLTVNSGNTDIDLTGKYILPSNPTDATYYHISHNGSSNVYYDRIGTLPFVRVVNNNAGAVTIDYTFIFGDPQDL